jgi:hypothetical protein
MPGGRSLQALNVGAKKCAVIVRKPFIVFVEITLICHRAFRSIEHLTPKGVTTKKKINGA